MTTHRHCVHVRLVALIVLLSLPACVVRHGDFSVMSNKMVRLSDFNLDQADRVKGIVGKDVQHVIIIFPTSGAPTLEAALDDAFEKGGGDVMTDVVVSSWSWYIPYLYGQSGWDVRGDVVKTRKN